MGRQGSLSAPLRAMAVLAIAFGACLAAGAARAAAFHETDGLVSIETENCTNNTGGWDEKSDGSASGGKFMEARRGRSKSSKIEYEISFSRTGLYRVWLRAKCTSDADNDCYVLLDDALGSCPTDKGWKRVSGVKTDQRSWGWQGTTKSEAHWDRSVRDRGTWVNVELPGDHTLALGSRSRDFKVDKVLLVHKGRPDANRRPGGEGPPETACRLVLPDEERSTGFRPAEAAISQGWAGRALRCLESLVETGRDEAERRRAERYAGLIKGWTGERRARIERYVAAGQAIAAYREADGLCRALAGHPMQQEIKRLRDGIRASDDLKTGTRFLRLRQALARADKSARNVAYARFARAHPESYYGRLAKEAIEQ